VIRYKRRTLLLVLALGPPLLIGGYVGWRYIGDWREHQMLKQEMRKMWERKSGKKIDP
jgi:hypothetical protein